MNHKAIAQVVVFVNARTGNQVRNEKMSWTNWLRRMESAVTIHQDGALLGSMVYDPEQRAILMERSMDGAHETTAHVEDALAFILAGGDREVPPVYS
jgi:hypothetical protein